MLLQSLSLSEVSNVGEKYLYLAPEEPDEAEPSLESAISLRSPSAAPRQRPLCELTITRLQHSSITKHLCRLSYIPRATVADNQRRARRATPDSTASRELATAVCLAGLLGWLAHMLSVQSSMVFLEISTPLLLPPHNAVHTVGFCRFSPPIAKWFVCWFVCRCSPAWCSWRSQHQCCCRLQSHYTLPPRNAVHTAGFCQFSHPIVVKVQSSKICSFLVLCV